MPEDNENQDGKGLRAQLEAALEENKSLKAELDTGKSAQRELAFLRAGIDLESGPGKLLAKSYDGELDPDEIVAFAEEYGISPKAAEQTSEDTAAQQTQQRTEQLRQQSTPEGSGQRLNHKEWLELSKTNPEAARAAHDEGMVDYPPHIAQNLAS